MELTEGDKGFGGLAGLGHADGIDGEDPHLVRNAFDHLLGLECRLLDQVKVQPHPPGALFLFPFHEVPFKEDPNKADP